MLTTVDDFDGERVLTVQIHEAAVDAELVSALSAVLDDVERDRIENLVLQFTGGPDLPAGDFPPTLPGPAGGRLPKLDELLAQLSGLSAKTFAAYDGWVGAAAIQVGLGVDLRLASAKARLTLGTLANGRLSGAAAYWLPKFVGLGTARKIFLLGADLTAEDACRLGLVDVVDDTVEEVKAAAIEAMHAVNPEAAYLTRRILNDSYFLEHSAAAELAKAARFKLAMPPRDR